MAKKSAEDFEIIEERTESCDTLLLREAFNVFLKSGLRHTRGCRRKQCGVKITCLSQRKIKGKHWLYKFLTEYEKYKLNKHIIHYNQTNDATRFHNRMEKIRRRLQIPVEC